MKKTISLVLAILLIASFLILPAAGENQRSTSELIQAIPGSDGATADGIYYDLFENFTDDPNGFITVLDELDSAAKTMVIESLSKYCLSDLRNAFECAIDELKQSETALALITYFNSVKNTYQGNIQTNIYMPEYDPSTIKQFVELNKANGFIYDEEFYALLTKVYNADTQNFAKVISDLSSSEMQKVALGLTLSSAKTGIALAPDYTKGSVITTSEAASLATFESTLDTTEALAVNSEESLSQMSKQVFNADILALDSTAAENEAEETEASLMAVNPAIGAMGWSNLNVGSAYTRLNVPISDPTNIGTIRTYKLRVYCYSYANNQWWLKNSGYTATLGQGADSAAFQVPVTFSAAGTILTKVEVWNAANSVMLLSQQKTGSDVVKGDWRINVDLPTNRNREGALGVYNASGEMVLPVIRCLGRSTKGTSMGTFEGNTPVGNNYGVLYPASSDTGAYGPYKRVLLTAMPGHPYPDRKEIMIHGGRSQTTLEPTLGCIRVFNSDQLAIQNKLENMMLPANGHNTTGTVIVSEQSYLD